MNAEPVQTSNWSDLGIRTLSAAVLIPAVLLDIWWGGIWFEIFVGLLGVLMAREWTDIASKGSPAQFAIVSAAALCAAVLPRAAGVPTALAAVAVLALVSVAVSLLIQGRQSPWSYIGVPYVALPVVALATLRIDPVWGVHAIIWIMVVVWSADSMAYFAGRIIGGPKLAPAISPKKTWAGLGGAVVGAALAGGIYATAVAPSVWPLVALAAGLALIEQAGDIFESAFKRFHGVKDSSNLIPGHGGIIDRVDGLLAVALAAACVGYFRVPGATAQGLLLW